MIKTCPTCHQDVPNPEISLVFPDNKTRQRTIDILESLALDCVADNYYKNITEVTLHVEEREIAALAGALHRAAGHKDEKGQPFYCLVCEDARKVEPDRPSSHIHEYCFPGTLVSEDGWRLSAFCKICGKRPEEEDAR